MGTLNFLSSKNTKRGVSLIQEGVTVSCARPVSFENTPDAVSTPVHYMIESGEGWDSPNKFTSRETQAATDYVGMVFHGHTVTHVDSLAHFFWKGRMYNDRPASMVSTNLGATVESIEIAGRGIVTRGVLIDVPRVRGVDWLEPGDGVTPEDITEAEKQQGITVGEGDVLLIRTGQLKRRNDLGPVDYRASGSNACQAACLPIFHERNIAMLGSDTGNDIMPAQYNDVKQPIHQVGIVAMGLWILDNADLEDLSKICIERSTWEFFLSIAPLKLSNTTGSPVNPLAIF